MTAPRRRWSLPPILFDVYFNLGSFYLGLCAALAYTTNANGPAHAVVIVAGGVLICILERGMRVHLRQHAEAEGWRFFRRLAPFGCCVVGFGLPFLAI
jgi:hypothetical protein